MYLKVNNIKQSIIFLFNIIIHHICQCRQQHNNNSSLLNNSPRLNTKINRNQFSLIKILLINNLHNNNNKELNNQEILKLHLQWDSLIAKINLSKPK